MSALLPGSYMTVSAPAALDTSETATRDLSTSRKSRFGLKSGSVKGVKSGYPRPTEGQSGHVLTTRWLPVILASVLLSSPLAHCAEVDARAEVAAALYAASATQAASERLADAKLRAQWKEIEQLRLKVSTSVAESAGLRADLASAEEKYVADLAERDRAYREEIAVFRASVQDIASTPEGAAALR
jgi:hypothetical protein